MPVQSIYWSLLYITINDDRWYPNTAKVPIRWWSNMTNAIQTGPSLVALNMISLCHEDVLNQLQERKLARQRRLKRRCMWQNYAKLPHWIMYMAVYNRITENIMKHRQAMTLTSITHGIFIEPLQRSATLAPMLHQWFFAWAEVDGCWCLPAQNAGICDVLCIRQSKNLKQLWNMACFLDDEPLNMVILHSDILDYQRIAFGV